MICFRHYLHFERIRNSGLFVKDASSYTDDLPSGSWAKTDTSDPEICEIILDRRFEFARYSDGKIDRIYEFFNRNDVRVDLLAFFHDRLKVYLRDQGARHDLIDAVLQGAPSPVSLRETVLSPGGRGEGGGALSPLPPGRGQSCEARQVRERLRPTTTSSP